MSDSPALPKPAEPPRGAQPADTRQQCACCHKEKCAGDFSRGMKKRKKANFRTCLSCVAQNQGEAVGGIGAEPSVATPSCHKDTANKSEEVLGLEPGAMQGDAKAQWGLGMCYLNGDGVAQDKREGIRLLRLSSNQAFAPAQCLLGQCYLIGDGVAQDNEEGVRLLRLSATQGDAVGQFCLAGCYLHGHGVAQDFKQAEVLLRLAAEQGSALASVKLSELFASGKLEMKDLEAARKMRKQARKQFGEHSYNEGSRGILRREFSRQKCSNHGCGKTENPDPAAEKAVSLVWSAIAPPEFVFHGVTCCFLL
jgi:TPR repeat protein